MNDIAQDLKKFRKLRKALRQIEHLNLLQRNLNQEEKYKISKRSIFREQLNKLFEKYPKGELLAYDSHDNTFDAEESQFTSQNTSLLKQDCLDIQELTDKLSEVKLQEFSAEIDQDLIPNSPIIIEQNQIIESNYCLNDEQLTDNKEEKKILETTPEESEDKVQNKSLKKVPNTNSKKHNVSFDTIIVPDAHQDLITCIDIDVSSGLIVTGSRDTSIKVWKFNDQNKNCELLKTFGEHGSIITQVKFWNSRDFKLILENLKLNKDENEDSIDLLDQINDEYLILSSSLDCSIRLWSIDLFKCLKEFYLYNPIKSFDTKNSYLLVGQDAGKVQLWKDFNQVKVIKPFEDTDNVVNVKFMDENKIYVLSQNGYFKILTFTDHDLEEVLCIDILEIEKKELNGKTKRNFKQFEALDMNNLIFLNDNQSYIIGLNLENKILSLIPTNSSSFAFSSCFFKPPGSNLIFVSSFDIDNAKSLINVFKKSNRLDYLYSIEDLDQDISISTLSSSDFKENCSCISIGAGKNLKIFVVENSSDVLLPIRSNKVKINKMMQEYEIKNHYFIDSNDESDHDEEEDEDNIANQEETKSLVKKSTCSIQ